jgi:hypothetical protein
MNWDAVGAFGEILGATAVVISVVYLAVQIRNQTVESKLAATRELAGKRAEIMRFVGSDDGIAEIWIKAIRSYASLKGIERMRASMLLHMVIRGAEQEFIHKGTGHADDPYLESVDRVLSRTLSFPGVRDWWETTGEGFNNEFQSHANELIASVKVSQISEDFDLQYENDTGV